MTKLRGQDPSNGDLLFFDIDQASPEEIREILKKLIDKLGLEVLLRFDHVRWVLDVREGEK